MSLLRNPSARLHAVQVQCVGCSCTSHQSRLCSSYREGVPEAEWLGGSEGHPTFHLQELPAQLSWEAAPWPSSLTEKQGEVGAHGDGRQHQPQSKARGLIGWGRAGAGQDPTGRGQGLRLWVPQDGPCRELGEEAGAPGQVAGGTRQSHGVSGHRDQGVGGPALTSDPRVWGYSLAT